MPYKDYQKHLANVKARYWRKREEILVYVKKWRSQNTARCVLNKRRYRREHPEWVSWMSMKERCNRRSHPYYKDYGGRGISIEYATFQDFFEDVGPKPSPEYEIDRIDNNGNYTKGNCRWVTHKQNCNNRRKPKCRQKVS